MLPDPQKGSVSEAGQPGSRRFRLESVDGLVAVVGQYGARLIELWAPDRDGILADVTLGFDRDDDYRANAGTYMGAILGRVSGRIRKARFSVDGQEFVLAANEPPNHLHGGALRSFDRVVWESRPQATGGHPGVRFEYRSPHLEEGYPGSVTTSVSYVLVGRELWLNFEAVTDRRTPISLTSHAFWNLGGAGAETVLDHELRLHASQHASVDAGLVPTGAVESVNGSPLDFVAAQTIGQRIAQLDEAPSAGYDHCYLIEGEAGVLRPAATLRHPASGRRMGLLTTEPALQVYSANRLDAVCGKAGRLYRRRSAICLEPQIVPDAVNRPGGRSIFLDPGRTYRHTTVFRFSADAS